MIGGGLTLNDTGFILVQAAWPTSSLSRSVTLFLSPGARSFERTLISPRRPRGGVNRPVKIQLETLLEQRAALPAL